MPTLHSSSKPAADRKVRAPRVPGSVAAVGFMVAALSLGLLPRSAAQSPAAVQRAFEEARQRFKAEPTNAPAAWEFGRACFDLAETATNNAERAAIAEQGIAASRQAAARDSNAAPAHYYLGLNLGQLARTRGLSALRLIREMEREWTTAGALDPHLDYGGPDRSLGLLYRDAPSIASVGSKPKAQQHLEKAVELAPEYPDNRLNLIESLLKWGERARAERELSSLEQTWPKARASFSGAAWAASWKDWEQRREAADRKLGKSGRLETPRH